MNEFKEDLTEKRLDIIDMSRMYKKTTNGNKIYTPLILVQLPKTEKSKTIYNMSGIHEN